MAKHNGPDMPEDAGVRVVNRRSNTGYSGDVRAGLGSVDLDPIAAKPMKKDKGIVKNPPMA